MGVDANNNIIKYDGRGEYLSKIDTLPQAVAGEVDFNVGIKSHYVEINSTTGGVSRITYDGTDVKINKELEVDGNITSTGANVISGQNVVAGTALSSNGTLYVGSTAQINGQTDIGSHMYATGRCGGLYGTLGGTSSASAVGGTHPLVECGVFGYATGTNGAYTGITFRKECMGGTCVLQPRTMDGGAARMALLVVANDTHFTSLAEDHIITGATTFAGSMVLDKAPPLLNTDAGTVGEIRISNLHLYVYIENSVGIKKWKRVGLANF